MDDTKDTVLTGGPGRPLQMSSVRSDGWTKKRREVFLAHLAATCNVLASARAVNMAVTGAYALRRRDPQFRALWRDALLDGYDHLEARLLAHMLGTVNDIALTMPETAPDAPFDAKLALEILARHRANREGKGRPPGGKRGRASEEEVDARLRTQLDALARRLRQRV